VIRTVLASALFMVSFASYAEAPAPWLIDHQKCIGHAAETRMASITDRLSKNDSRKLAEEIYVACANFMPNDMTATERAKFIDDQSRIFAKRLRYQSGNVK